MCLKLCPSLFRAFLKPYPNVGWYLPVLHPRNTQRSVRFIVHLGWCRPLEPAWLVHSLQVRGFFVLTVIQSLFVSILSMANQAEWRIIVLPMVCSPTNWSGCGLFYLYYGFIYYWMIYWRWCLGFLFFAAEFWIFQNLCGFVDYMKRG